VHLRATNGHAARLLLAAWLKTAAEVRRPPCVPAARQLFGGLWEVVRARELHHLAPELWTAMRGDENGHAKGLPPNRRAGELHGADAIVGDALICEERFSGEELSSFSQAEAAQALATSRVEGLGVGGDGLRRPAFEPFRLRLDCRFDAESRADHVDQLMSREGTQCPANHVHVESLAL
jgi:hypothetical protein